MRASLLLILIGTLGFYAVHAVKTHNSVKESCMEVVEEHGGEVIGRSIYKDKMSGRAIINDRQSTFLCLTQNHKADMLLVDNEVIWRK